MPEISDAQLAVYKQTTDLMEALYADKEHSLSFKKMVKAKIPGARIPELDIGEQIVEPIRTELVEANAKVSALTERLDKMQKDREDADLDGKFRTALTSTQQKYKLTDEGMSKVMDVMKARQLADPEAAAALYLRDLPPVKPAGGPGYLPQNIDMFGSQQGEKAEEKVRSLHNNPMNFFDNEVREILSDPQYAAA
jgi:hypothetical protein